MESITIDNYEVFYLDFLDGNLSEEERQLFLDFLELHPELKFDHEEVIYLDSTDNDRLDFLEKELLKQTDWEKLTISFNSIETLLIAQKEGLLSPDKSVEIDAFVLKDEDLIRLQKELSFAHFTPDMAIKFEAKSELKKKSKVIPIWVISVSIAASILFLISISIFMNQEAQKLYPKHSNPLTSEVIQVKKENENQLPEKKVINYSNDQIKEKRTNTNNVVLESKPSDSSPILSEEIILENLNITEIDHNFDVAILTSNIQERSVKTQYSIEKNEIDLVLNDVVSKSINRITQKISDLTDREIDFKLLHSNPIAAKGFYLKVGNFEVMHSINQ